MTTNHSVLPPSSAARRVMCPGSRALEEAYPSGESQYTREGEAAHWVARMMLETNCEISLNDLAPNGEIITQEMIDGAKIYRSHICSMFLPYYDLQSLDKMFNELIAFGFLAIEKTIPIRFIHHKCFGTPDAYFYDQHSHTLHVWDYKFGYSYVEVFENWQLIEYAAGLFDSLTNHIHTLDSLNIVDTTLDIPIQLHIVQPRNYHSDGPLRTWKTNVSELKRYWITLRAAEQAAMQPEAECKPSSECNNCNARHVCPALQLTTSTIMDLTAKNVPMELPPEQLGFQLKYLIQASNRLDAIITGLKEQAIASINLGNRIPNFVIEETPGRQKWKVPDKEIINLGNLLGVNIAKPVEALTPKQAIKAGIPEDIVNSNSEVTRGSTKLVLENPNKIKKLFEENR